MPLPDGPAIITGGSSGIGLAVALRLAAAGHPVALIARSQTLLDAARAQICALHPQARVHCASADVTDPAALGAAIAAANAALGPASMLVCSAGITAPGLFAELPATTHRRTMEVNYFGTLNAVQASLPLMAPGGRIAIISSAAALTGFYGYSGYAPSKFALRGLAEVLRVELAERGIGVTLCMPPDTDTPQLAAEIPLRPKVTGQIAALGRVLAADTVAAALVNGMAANRFLVLPGVSIRALHVFGGVLGPAMRALQRYFIRQSRPDTGAP